MLQPSSVTTNSYVETDQQWLTLNLQRKIAALYVKSISHVRGRGEQYKLRHDVKVHSKPKSVHNQWVFGDKPTLFSGRNKVDGTVTTTYNKLQSPKGGLFCIVKVQSHTVVVEEDGMSNTAFIHQITTSLGSENNNHAPILRHARECDSLHTMSRTPRHPNHQTTKNVARGANPQTEYVAKQVVGHKGGGRIRQYIVRWYGYGTEHDSLEPGRDISQNFVIRYTERENSKQASSHMNAASYLAEKTFKSRVHF